METCSGDQNTKNITERTTMKKQWFDPLQIHH